MFIHTRVRLFCELQRAQRWLTVDTLMAQWLKDESKQMEITGVEPREKVEGLWAVTGSQGTQDQERLEFHLMQCASRTQYCTEIHLIVYPGTALLEKVKALEISQTSEALEQWRSEVKAAWQQRLESLRQCVNGDWIIEDRDLNRGVLLKSRI